MNKYAMKLHAPLKLVTSPLIQEAASKLMQEQWDYKTEKLLRLPLDGVLADAVNTELRGLGIPPISIWTVFARGPGGIQPIHVDAASTTERVDSGIIVPVLGTIGSKMQWFSEEGLVLKNVQNSDRRSTLFVNVSMIKPKVIAELEVSEPTLVKLSVPHRAVASITHPRAVVSIKFVGNPVLL